MWVPIDKLGRMCLWFGHGLIQRGLYIYIGHIDIVVIDEGVNNKVWKPRDWFRIRNDPKL